MIIASFPALGAHIRLPCRPALVDRPATFARGAGQPRPGSLGRGFGRRGQWRGRRLATAAGSAGRGLLRTDARNAVSACALLHLQRKPVHHWPCAEPDARRARRVAPLSPRRPAPQHRKEAWEGNMKDEKNEQELDPADIVLIQSVIDGTADAAARERLFAALETDAGLRRAYEEQ